MFKIPQISKLASRVFSWLHPAHIIYNDLVKLVTLNTVTDKVKVDEIYDK